MYECIKGFLIEICDGDGFTIENKYMDINKGTIWNIPEDKDYRFIGREIRLENNELGWIEITKEHLEEYFEEIKEKDKVVQLNITDELGTHTLQAKDFVVKCNKCKRERPLYEDDINDNEINPKVCDCGGLNKFHYWLDGVYTEEEYDELLSKSKNN